ncbi:hypothetical protein [Candidatus Methanocrinis natronophilus]|uniref:Pappalysin-1 SD scarf domain-containing protein n=1 Tax=Candidatus Methanocrinis natronophilus TaxID=3033396 RepID=A0ABT5X5I1_9EURY|nr:hypothetical protein [Candidatus Methanocrinis natronophilus]MDF0589842.1 hypothetical protein [Candidatus Methanocrinis natronophilus]
MAVDGIDSQEGDEMKLRPILTTIAMVVFLLGVTCIATADQSTISASPSAVNLGDEITVNYSGAPGFDTDWIAIYRTGAANERYGGWYYLRGEESGTLTFTAPMEAGDYEFRMFKNWGGGGGYNDIARSNIVSVGVTSPQDGSFIYWAAHATASSEYSSDAWSALQATGEPDTYPDHGDIETAWAPLEEDAGVEWLDLEYEVSVLINRVDIYETFNPGAVSGLEIYDDTGDRHLVWEGTMEPAKEARISSIEIRPAFPTNRIRILLDTTRVPGWNEIDAVGLIGTPSSVSSEESDDHEVSENDRSDIGSNYENAIVLGREALDPATLEGGAADAKEVPIIKAISVEPLYRHIKGGDMLYLKITLKNEGSRHLYDGYIQLRALSPGRAATTAGSWFGKIPPILVGHEAELYLILETNKPELMDERNPYSWIGPSCVPYAIDGWISELMAPGDYISREGKKVTSTVGRWETRGIIYESDAFELNGCCLEPPSGQILRNGCAT